MPNFPAVSAAARVAVAIAICLLLGACATTKREPLPNGVLPVSGVLPVEVYLGQQEILIESQNTNPMAAGGGILGALIVTAIDNAAAKKDEVRAASIRDALIGADLNPWILDTIEQGIDHRVLASELAVEFYPATPLARISDGDMQSRKKVLVVDVSYGLTPDFRALRVRLLTRFGDRVIYKKRDRSKYLYVQILDSLAPLPGDRKDSKEDERALMWAELGQEALVDLVQSGVHQALDMLNWTYATAESPPTPTERATFTLGRDASGVGKLERIQGDRRWIRVLSNFLVSVPE